MDRRKPRFQVSERINLTFSNYQKLLRMPESPSSQQQSNSGLSLDEFINRQAAIKAKVSSTKRDEIEVKVKVKLPPRGVRTIRDLVYWEYAKLIGKSAGFEKNYGFIMSRYTKLKSGQIHISGLEKDDEKVLIGERKCAYCGSPESLCIDHIIPLVKGGLDITSNKVLSCRKCNSSKLQHDIFEWYFMIRNEQEIPKMVWGKYLKLIWDFHALHHTLDRSDVNKDGKLDVLDLGAILKTYEEKR